MADDKLVGNVATEKLIEFLEEKEHLQLDLNELIKCQTIALKIFEN
jgi:hypothetical protein